MFENFMNEMKEEFNSFNEYNSCKGAEQLNRIIENDQKMVKKLGKGLFNKKKYPHYFTGNLKSKLVVVNLNPKDDSDDTNDTKNFEDWNKFVNYFSNFGNINYGNINYGNDEIQYKSKFDINQLEFYKGFGEIDLLDDSNVSNSEELLRENLRRIVQNKLQLELIPYASGKFDSDELYKNKYFKSELEKRILSILDIIVETNRDYVLFCGKIFEKFFIDSFQNYITKEYDIHSRRFLTKSNKLSQSRYSYCNIEFEYKHKKVRAGLAISYFSQALNYSLMRKYGQFCGTYKNLNKYIREIFIN